MVVQGEGRGVKEQSCKKKNSRKVELLWSHGRPKVVGTVTLTNVPVLFSSECMITLVFSMDGANFEGANRVKWG